ncbi:MAG: radical SAM protein [Suilimivivens sp.]
MIRDISFEITQRCLNNCVHCSSCSNSLCEQYIDYDTVCKTIDDMPQIGVERVCLSGGEPFLHKDLKNIVTYIKQLGMEVNIYSSGITEDAGQITYIRTNEFLDLKKRGLSKIMFNLQSYDPSRYDAIMGTSGRFGIVKKSIRNAIEAGLYTEIHFVPMKINVDDIDGIVEMAKEMNVNKVSFLKLVPHGRADKNKNLIQLSSEETITLRNKLSEIKSETVRIGIPLSLDFDSDFCHAASSKLYIKFDGTVYGCEAFKYIQQLDGESNVIQPNNIFGSSLLEIYNNSKYLKATQDFVKKYSCLNSKCESCPVQKFLEMKGEK